MKKWISFLIVFIIFILLLIPCHTEVENFKTIDNMSKFNPKKVNNEGNNYQFHDKTIIRNLGDTGVLTKDILGSNELADSYVQKTIKPFNEIDERISKYSLNESLNKDYDNSYFDLYRKEELEADNLYDKESQTIKEQCYPYKNINQCMSICSNHKLCTGFYTKNDGTCCPILEPDFRTDRHSYYFPPDNTLFYSFNKYNDRTLSKVNPNNIYRYYDSENGNNSYYSEHNMNDCLKMCPKCIPGQCPVNYRCNNVRSDPTKKIGCIITNEDRYDENKNLVFDSGQVPKLDMRYAINFNSNVDPNTTK
jgi:hypothetical protein